MTTAKSFNIAILAMGGEGGGVLADWIVDMAEHAGYYVQTTSVPGVAQRTGATIYYVEIFPEIGGQQPVLALMPFPGEVDVVIASELMEAGRAIQRGLVTPERTTFIASTHRVYSMTERTAMGDGRVDAQALLDACRAAAQWFVSGDFARAAEDTGSVISAVMFGALAGTGRLPFSHQAFEEAIRRGGVGVESSLSRVRGRLPHRDARRGARPAPATTRLAAAVGPALSPLADRVEREFPAAARATLLAGIRRLADYQDVAYAAEYLDRLTPIRALDRDAGLAVAERNGPPPRPVDVLRRHHPRGRSEDPPPALRARARQRSGSTLTQLLQINEFLHPRVEEIADTLPAGLGRWLLRTGWARAAGGPVRFAGPRRADQLDQRLPSALLRRQPARMRRATLRFAEETVRIEEWLTHIRETASADHALAVEIAACQGLVKGYSDTHARGLRNFQTVMSALPGLRGKPDASARLRSLREAALADESGARLESALKEIAPMSRYRGNPKAIAALVQDDQVHRDVYIDPEIFELEMEQLWSNTWIYVGHVSQVPRPGDYATTDIATRPVVMVRHEDGTVRVLMNRCAHKGSKVVSAPAGNTGRFFRCPYHGWAYNTDGSIRAIPLKSGYDGTRVMECDAGKGPGSAEQRRDVSRLRVRTPVGSRSRLPGLLRRIALLDRQHGRPLARGRAGDHRRCAALPAQLQLEDVRREPQRHDAPDGGARVLGRHREEAVGRQARGPAQADGRRAVRPLRLGLQVLRRHGCARAGERPRLVRREVLDPFQLCADPRLRRADGRGLRRAARA